MSPQENVRPTRRRLPVVLIVIGLLAILVAVIVGAAWGGYQSGTLQRERERQATQTAELKKQYDLGISDLAAGNYVLATQRFEYILGKDPNYPGAAEKLIAAKVAQQITPTPTPPPSPTPVATGDAPAAILALAQQSYDAKNWDDVILRLTQLRALDLNYEAVKVDGMLFAALRNRGIARINAKDLEGGIFDLNQSEAFGKLDQDAASHRLWARYYLDAMSYWGLNWPKTISLLSDLHGFAPYFHDTAAKLLEARLKYATQLTAAKDYCGAAQQYSEAQTLSPSQPVADKLTAVQAQCVPTPAGGMPSATATNLP